MSPTTIYIRFRKLNPRSNHWTIRFIDDGPQAPDPIATVALYNTNATATTAADWMYLELTDLHQRQQYAYYVHAQVAQLNESTSSHDRHGISPIQYFTTATRRPLPPFVYTTAKANDSFSIAWFHPAWDTHRYVETYVIDVFRLPDDVDRLLDGRNYCLDPKVITPPQRTHYINNTEPFHDCCAKLELGLHARFLTGHIGLDGDPDACGPDDHHCRQESELHVLLQNDSWYADEDEQRLAAVRAEELIYMVAPEVQALERQREAARRPPAAAPRIMKALPRSTPNLVRSLVLPANDTQQQRARFGGLLAFERYAVRVYACTRATQCGHYFQHFERTQRTLAADDVRVRIVSERRMPDRLLLEVRGAATRPNGGVIVAFEVERYRNEVFERMVCVTGREMQRLKGVYVFLVV